MKIYKLDIDASKPIRKVVQMQQNSTGALSVDVSSDGKYIRNLSCALYDGDTELSAYTTTDVGAGFKIDMGADTKVVKLTAKSTPLESVCEYVAVEKAGGRLQTKALSCVQLEAGTYNQDEFYGLANRFGSYSGIMSFIFPTPQTEANINVRRITLAPWNTEWPVQFMAGQSDADLSALPKDEPIVVTGLVSLVKTTQVKQGSTLSSYTYPAVGYWTDYSLETVIRPSENAHCYAEQEVTDLTPDPEEPVEP